MDEAPRAHTSDLADVERARFLWEEYRYRHDLIWRLLFRMTFVAALVSTVPFTNDKLDDEVKQWVDTLPALALALVAVGWIVLAFELRLFKPINDRYVELQKTAVGKVREPGPDIFAWVVLGYPGVLLVLLAVVAAAAWSS